uniref:precorrin-2 dehydrogenase/sirohydrochlorin ferrochelatase family protein n=1 Tax=Parerythrobacter lutipelagi TaxID=1964208 RepID=UPI0018648DDB|nr:NAD(P)-dependent oxidoreductase [Parerythrobacter lutipelagi]
MIRSLPLLHRIDGKKVVVVAEGAMGEAKTRLVERAGGIPCGEPEAHHAALAFIALEDAREAEAAARRLKAKGLLVNVADRPELCDFTTPSILDRDPVLIAIGTSGASAGLAKQLRLRLEALLPQSLGKLAARLETARGAMRAKYPDASQRRQALDLALSEGGILDPLDPRSAEHVEKWLGSKEIMRAETTITFEVRSDDPQSLTLRQAQLLGMADTVAHEPDIPSAILDRARADAARIELPIDQMPASGLTIVLRRAR